jgi:hypothetical protein
VSAPPQPALLVDDLVVRGAGVLWLDFLAVAAWFPMMLAAATRAYPKAIL